MMIFDRIKKAVFRLIPERRFIPVVSTVLLQLVVYSGTMLFRRSDSFYDLSTPLDRAIPFTPIFVIFYVLAFFQWARYYLLIAREEDGIARRFLTANVISKLICFLFFIFLPTRMTRPEIKPDGLFSLICSVIYSLDSPTNLFPSMHCLESWMCMRLALEQRRKGRIPVLVRGQLMGYSGDNYIYIGLRQWKKMKSQLVAVGTGKMKPVKFLHGIRKWTLKADIDTLPEGGIEYNEIYIKTHTGFTCLLSALVVLSTVFIKQHLAVDTVSGILVAELSLFVSSIINKSLN